MVGAPGETTICRLYVRVARPNDGPNVLETPQGSSACNRNHRDRADRDHDAGDASLHGAYQPFCCASGFTLVLLRGPRDQKPRKPT